MTPDPGGAAAADRLGARLSALTRRDERRLRGRLARARRLPAGQQRAAALDAVRGEVAEAEQRLARRLAAVPEVTYPDLPVTARRAELLAAIRDHQVVAVAGETGSGKTTQLPKICLELGRGVRGVIGHTQPRRLAARTVAARIAEELAVPLGGAVGFAVRFTDRVSDATLVKLMTDGLLLAELPRDRDLLAYDTVIVDEAHERSLNVDFLLGYLHRLLPRRPDLKVIITSATIDPGRFAAHFGGAPVVEVSGRTFPVEVRYRPLVAEEGSPERDQVGAICAAVDELAAEPAGDVLVFLSGEREIRDTADSLRALDLPRTEVLPLFARLPTAEQHKVFEPHAGRRIVLATNVAETSLTVPGVRYVVDPGTVRLSRYSHRTKVQRLPIEPVSQASAQQRSGRCGRVAPGVCIRLYAEDDLLARPRFTDPEILRTNLASVLLQMAALGLGDLAEFPFLDPPDRRGVLDGLRLLHELGAIAGADPDLAADGSRRLTPDGRLLARLPIDPRLGRILVAADREGALTEALVVVAALAIQDPRERPFERRAAADAAHARFADPDSDFVAFLRLWDHLREQRRGSSSNQFRRLCRDEFLAYQRVREWQDVHGQLRTICRDLGLALNDAAAGRDALHRALLAGLLSHVGRYDEQRRDYLGARGARFTLSPGSALARSRRPPGWVMAAELVETHRLRARTVARVDPAWVERLAAHLVQRTYSEPRWDAVRAQVLASEKVTLYGIPLVAGRSVGYARVDPVVAHELFVRHALVQGEWTTHHAFVAANADLLERAGELEHRLRRSDVVVDGETLVAFFAERVPREVVSGAHFDRWWKRARAVTPDLLTFPAELLQVGPATSALADSFPDAARQDDVTLPLSYRFEPGTAADGVTVDVPLAVLNRVRADELVAPVPGLRQDLVTALVRALPKALRRAFVPAPDTAREVLARLGAAEPTLAAVARELERRSGLPVPVEAFDLTRVPGHLRPTFRVVDDEGRTVAEGDDLEALRGRLRPQVRAAVARAADGLERTGLVGWPEGPLPRVVEREVAGRSVRGYPALVDEAGTVALRVLPSAAEQRAAMGPGTRRLLLTVVPSPLSWVNARLTNEARLVLARSRYPGPRALLDDCVAAAVDELVAGQGGPAWDAEGFARLLDAVRGALPERTLGVVRSVERVLRAAQEVDLGLARATAGSVRAAHDDVRAQVDALVPDGFVAAVGAGRLDDVARYLRAAAYRLDRMPGNPARDADLMAQVHDVDDALADALARLPAARRSDPDVVAVRWQVEELRVSLFAQVLRTPAPVSATRVLRAVDALARPVP